MSEQHQNPQSDHDLLIRIDERTRTFVDLMDGVHKANADHETRLRSIESWKSKLTGQIAIIAAVASVAGQVAMFIIQRVF